MHKNNIYRNLPTKGGGGGNAACSSYPPSLESLTFGGMKSIPLNDFWRMPNFRKLLHLFGVWLG